MFTKEMSDTLKKGPLGSVYARLRYWKRRLRSQSLTGVVEWTPAPLPIEELLLHAANFTDSARLCYSLGLDYLESETSDAALRALACLRSAEALRFASPERIHLFRSLAVARLGHTTEAHTLVNDLLVEELTASENVLRLRILNNEVTAFGETLSETEAVAATRKVVEEAAPQSMLVIGAASSQFATFQSATWLPAAAYVCIDAELNGLTLRNALDLSGYEVGLASAKDQQAAIAAGVRCNRWITLPTAATGEV